MLQIFDTKTKGKGVKTLSFIQKNSIITEYGNIRYKNYNDNIPCEKCSHSKWCCPKHDRLMKLPDNTWIDCDKKHISGFINHSSSKPNCKTISNFEKHDNLIHVYIVATQDILPNTELLYNYFR